MAYTLEHVRFEGVTGPRRLPATARAGQPAAVAESHSFDQDLPSGFVRWVLERAGLSTEAYRGTALARRVPACLRALRVRSEDEARGLLIAQPERLAIAVDALIIGVTAFFRDLAVFEGLRTLVMPGLRERPPVRVWSAGCSDGAELYSVGLLLAEAGLLGSAELLGTDCRASAVRSARQADYGEEVLRNVDERLRRQWFECVNDRWFPGEVLRERTRWLVSDILHDVQPGPWDLVLWRNAAIYLRPSAVFQVYERLARELAPGGFLVVGRAERVPPALGLRAVSRCTYQRVAGPRVLSPTGRPNLGE